MVAYEGTYTRSWLRSTVLMKDQGDVVIGRARASDLSGHRKSKLRSLDAFVIPQSESRDLIELTASA